MKRVAVVGAGLAGLSAVRALRANGFTGEVVVVGAERHRPYDRPPLSKDFLGGTGEPGDLSLEKPAEDLAATWLLGDPAVALDPGGLLTLQSGRTVPADGFVIAAGARARTLPGSTHLSGVHTLRTLDDAIALRADLASARRLVVVGAGFIGAEVASTARGLDRRLDITVVEALAAPLASPLGDAMGAVVAALHENHGVRLLRGRGVAGLEPGVASLDLGPAHGVVGVEPGVAGLDPGPAPGVVAVGPGMAGLERSLRGDRNPGLDLNSAGRHRVTGVRLADGTLLPADLVVVGIGAVPALDWVAGSGLVLDASGGIRCGADGGTGVANVVAVGDCAAWFEPRLGRHVRVEHWTSAAERARTAARTLLGLPAAPARQPYFWSDQYGARIQFVGHALAGDEVTVELGDPGEHRFLAVYRRAGLPVAVLAVDLVGPFATWRRHLETPPRPGADDRPGLRDRPSPRS